MSEGALTTHNDFFGPITKKRNVLVGAYGQDRVYQSVRLIGGRPAYPRDKRRRVMYIPVNAETLDSPDCTVILEMTASEQSWHYRIPLLYTWPPTPEHGIHSLHPSNLTEEQQKQYQNAILKKLSALEFELTSTRDGI